jgi:hypothetical protein
MLLRMALALLASINGFALPGKVQLRVLVAPLPRMLVLRWMPHEGDQRSFAPETFEQRLSHAWRAWSATPGQRKWAQLPLHPASENLYRVVGIQPCLLQQAFLATSASYRGMSDAPHEGTERRRGEMWNERISQWEDVNRGRDLFVRHLTKFEVASAYNAVIQINLDSHESDDLGGSWIVIPAELRAYGHFRCAFPQESAIPTHAIVVCPFWCSCSHWMHKTGDSSN